MKSAIGHIGVTVGLFGHTPGTFRTWCRMSVESAATVNDGLARRVERGGRPSRNHRRSSR